MCFVLWLTKPPLSGLGIRGPLGTIDALLAVVSVCRMLHTCCVWFVGRLIQHCTGWRHQDTEHFSTHWPVLASVCSSICGGMVRRCCCHNQCAATRWTCVSHLCTRGAVAGHLSIDTLIQHTLTPVAPTARSFKASVCWATASSPLSLPPLCASCGPTRCSRSLSSLLPLCGPQEVRPCRRLFGPLATAADGS